jgi:hypothetical protein
MQYIFDQTPIWAREQFVAGMHSLLTSSTIQWFFLRTQNDALMRNQNVKLWLDTASAELYRIFNSSRHNFASQQQQLYSDQGLIGTACMAVLESRKSGVLFSTHHMKECVLAENDEDRIDTNIRRWQYTADQAWAMWGKAAGEKVEKAMSADGKPDEKFWFLHSVTPRMPARSAARRQSQHGMGKRATLQKATRPSSAKAASRNFPISRRASPRSPARSMAAGR